VSTVQCAAVHKVWKSNQTHQYRLETGHVQSGLWDRSNDTHLSSLQQFNILSLPFLVKQQLIITSVHHFTCFHLRKILSLASPIYPVPEWNVGCTALHYTCNTSTDQPIHVKVNNSLLILNFRSVKKGIFAARMQSHYDYNTPLYMVIIISQSQLLH
jgi:hypothetical protein